MLKVKTKADILKYLELKMQVDGYHATSCPSHLMTKYDISQGVASDHLRAWQKWRLNIIHNTSLNYEEKEKALNNFGAQQNNSLEVEALVEAQRGE